MDSFRDAFSIQQIISPDEDSSLAFTTLERPRDVFSISHKTISRVCPRLVGQRSHSSVK